MVSPTIPTRPFPPSGPEPPDREPPGPEPGREPHRGPWRRTTLVAVALAVVVTALLTALVLVLTDDDAGDGGPAASTPTSAVTSPTTDVTQPTTQPTTSPTTGATTTSSVVAPPVDTSTAVFPDAGGSLRFDDPVSAARAFAVDFVGFDDPRVGEFQAGDNRSGEVQVRPAARGPVTTVIVRRLEDETWWVLGSAAPDITVDRPATGATVRSPLTVSGEALAFEGQVTVEVREDGRSNPIGTGYVTGGGGPAAPFEGTVTFSEPDAEYGALLFLAHSPRAGEVWQASVFRVRFG